MTAREAGGAIPMDIATKRKLISNGKERGYITYEELNVVFPEKGSEEQIEEFMKRLAELDIKLIERAVTIEAGITRYPSISLFSSSTKTNILPRLASFKISLIFENFSL